MAEHNETDTNETERDEIPGDYDTLDGLKTRVSAIGNPVVAGFIERAETRIVGDGGEYTIKMPDADASTAEMLFHFGILTGAALEREYPAPNQSDESD